MEKRIVLMAAMARNRAIGIDGRMPWHLPGELKHFKTATMGKPIVMGRRTYESIGKPLPGRQNIVVSRNPDHRLEGCTVCTSLEAALEVAEGEEVMIIGGGTIYQQAMELATHMLLTLIDCEPEADTWFPAWDQAEWRLLEKTHYPADEKNAYSFDVCLYQRQTVGAVE